MAQDFRCGYVTIIGRPNVGKSTLINRILGQKLSITSSKPQTTRWNLLGIKTTSSAQTIYVDTPGIQRKYSDAMSRHMLREVTNSFSYMDVLIFMVEALVWSEMDENILKMIMDAKNPTILVVNKVDKIKEKKELLPFLEELSSKREFVEIVPISARTGAKVEAVESIVESLLPVAPPEFPEDQLTDRNERFFAAEFIREKLTRKLGEELPYRISVTIEQFTLKDKTLHIHAIIWVEGDSQKSIIIGKHGSVLKSVGELARKDMEKMFGHKVFLRTWVKVKKKWTSDLKALKQFGYGN